jgi:hypothetical protein
MSILEMSTIPRWGWEELDKVSFRKEWPRLELGQQLTVMMSMRIWEGFKEERGLARKKKLLKKMKMNLTLRKCTKIFGKKHKVIKRKLKNNKKNNLGKN